MTNYEWLIKYDKLHEFLADYGYAYANAEESDFYKKYKITPTAHLYAIEHNIVSWLQEERPEPNQYVLLDDVLTIMNNGHYVPKTSTFEQVVLSYINYKKTEISALPIKEIEG